MNFPRPPRSTRSNMYWGDVGDSVDVSLHADDEFASTANAVVSESDEFEPQNGRSQSSSRSQRAPHLSLASQGEASQSTLGRRRTVDVDDAIRAQMHLHFQNLPHSMVGSDEQLRAIATAFNVRRADCVQEFSAFLRALHPSYVLSGAHKFTVEEGARLDNLFATDDRWQTHGKDVNLARSPRWRRTSSINCDRKMHRKLSPKPFSTDARLSSAKERPVERSPERRCPMSCRWCSPFGRRLSSSPMHCRGRLKKRLWHS
jgi:hypothetical protein